ncbi:MAG: 30S ribosomal protein S15 [Methermicoccaceae archaeon]
MARMYSKRRGKSHSKPPMRTAPPEWTIYSGEEVERLVLKLWADGKSTSEIGIVLRDQYGVPDVALACGKKILKIVESAGHAPSIPEDIGKLIEKAVRLRKHIGNNKKDVHNGHSLHLCESKIRRLAHYYRREGRLPRDWMYSPETAEMLITR